MADRIGRSAQFVLAHAERLRPVANLIILAQINARPIGDTHFIPVVSHSIAPCYRTVLQRAQPSQVAEIAGTKAPPDGLDPMAASNTKPRPRAARPADRKSTSLNSSH